MSKISSYAPLIIRLGLASVMLWFGTSQLSNPGSWTGIVPEWATGLSGMAAGTIVFLNGVFEIVAGSMLALGIFSRIFALVLSAHLFVVTFDLGLTAIGVRDFGLSVALLSVAMAQTDEFCLLSFTKKLPV